MSNNPKIKYAKERSGNIFYPRTVAEAIRFKDGESLETKVKNNALGGGEGGSVNLALLVASEQEAREGTSNEVLMTPLRTKQLLEEQDLGGSIEPDLVIWSEYGISEYRIANEFVVLRGSILNAIQKCRDGENVKVVCNVDTGYFYESVNIQQYGNILKIYFEDRINGNSSFMVAYDCKNGEPTRATEFEYHSHDSGSSVELDLVLTVSDSLKNSPTPSVESGSVLNVFNKCRDKENPRVLLKYVDGNSVKLYEPTTIMTENSLSEKVLVLSFKNSFTEDGDVVSGEYIIKCSGETNISNGLLNEVYYINTLPKTKTSQLENDSKFITKEDIPEAQVPDLTGYAKESYVKEYAQPKGNYLTEHQSLEEYAKTKDHYTKTESDSKYQPKGNYLTEHQNLDDYAKKNEIPTKLSQLEGDSTHKTVTDAEKQSWDSKSNFSGNYNDLSNKPTIPTKMSQLEQDVEFASDDYDLIIRTEYPLCINEIHLWADDFVLDTFNKAINGEPVKIAIKNDDGEQTVEATYVKADNLNKTFTLKFDVWDDYSNELFSYIIVIDESQIINGGTGYFKNVSVKRYATKDDLEDYEKGDDYDLVIESEYESNLLEDNSWWVHSGSVLSVFNKLIEHKPVKVAYWAGGVWLYPTSTYVTNHNGNPKLHLYFETCNRNGVTGETESGSTILIFEGTNAIENGEVTNVVYKSLATKDEIPSLAGYATETYVQNKIAEAQLEGEDVDLTGYATKDDLKGYAKTSDIPTDYAKSDHSHSQYLTEHQSLSGYAKSADHYTKTESDSKYQPKGTYLTEHQSLADYAKKSEIPTDYAKPSDIPTKLSQLSGDETHRTVTDTEKSTWDAKSNFSGKFSDLSNKPTTLSGYGITDGASKEDLAKFGGTVEVTSGNPSKENTVLTLNPNAEEVNIYTVEEVDALVNSLLAEITKLKKAVPKVTYVTLTSSAWGVVSGEEDTYSQVVNISGVSDKTKVAIDFSLEQTLIFKEKNLAFVIENDNGVVTFFAVGQKPQNDYTLQITLSELVEVADE